MKPGHLIVAIMTLLLIAGCQPDTGEDSTASEKAALADIKLQEGDPGRALSLLNSALENEPSNPDVPLWEVARGESLFDLGRRDEAHAVVSRYTSSGNPAVKARALLLKARIDAPSSPSSALHALASLNIEALDAYRAEAAVDLCREQLNNVRTEVLPGYRDQGWLELYILLELEDRFAGTGDISKAALYGEEIDRLYPGAHQIWGRPDYGQSETGSDTWIAMLMPLTGEGSVYAKQVSQGAHLAFNRFAEMHSAAPELVDFDTGGSQSRLMELILSLADNPSCVAILGPLTSSSTLAAGSVAKREEIPLLSPTATSGDVDRIGDPVFRLVISEGDQAAAVAEYAVREGGFTRFGILFPYTAQATGEAEQFRSVVERMGGSVVSSLGYQPGDTDFRSQITSLKANSPQAVFLPVSAWDAVQIAPQLRFYRLEVPLFGTSGWDDDLLLRHGGEYVEGAIFTAAFGLNSLYPETARFVYTYNRTYGEEPTAIAAQGFDAADILLDAWSQASNHTRSRISRKLSSMGPWYGASGRCILGSDTENRISWPMMTVIDGEILGIQ
ncbi:MAG: penicillin-binding protein activator [Candidatus Sabulitectum sp.]|nr:penicillin-binding protein activator [Candidatus Sabulitectum sp.]